MKVSNYISLNEILKSNTALRLNVDNTKITDDQLYNFKKLGAKVFDPLREWVGGPIKINSGFRSPELNKAIGGSSNSQHCFGEAIDMDAGEDNYKLFNWIKNNVAFDQLIWEFGTDSNPNWIHISYTERRPNRQMILKTYKDNGVTKYKQI